jgi:hypothetical protein
MTLTIEASVLSIQMHAMAREQSPPRLISSAKRLDLKEDGDMTLVR